MDIRQAILAAADHIERNPSEFNFYSIDIPRNPGCGTPGCALGWIATFLGMSNYSAYHHGKGLEDVLGISSIRFYSRMIELDPSWHLFAENCAKTLRLYVDKYHPVPALPQAVRDIFSMSPADLGSALEKL